ncbi:MAG TPA: hypothetical protein VHE83_19210, partial [Mycobacteriales bacterium]|nr:hypothetical protein [Mycobacteriales bacterium]
MKIKHRAVAVVALGVVAAAGCGSVVAGQHARSTHDLAPKDALVTGTKALLGGHDLTAIVRLDTTPEALVAATKADAKAHPDDVSSPLTLDQATAIAQGSITLRIHAHGARTVGEDLAAPGAALLAGDDLEMVIGVGGGGTVDLRAAGGALYARADVPQLVHRFGGAKAAAALTLGLTSIPGKYKDAATAAVNGEWVEVPGASITKARSAFAKTPFPFPITDATAEMRVVADSLLKVGTVTRRSSDDQGDELTVTFPLRTFVADAGPKLVAAANAALPSALRDGTTDVTITPSPSDVPDQTETFDVTVRDGVLAHASADLVADGTPDFRKLWGGDAFGVGVGLSDDPVVIAAPQAKATFDVGALVEAFLPDFNGIGSFDSGSCVTEGGVVSAAPLNPAT